MSAGLGKKTKSIAHRHLVDLERRGHIKRLRLANGLAMKRAIEIVHERHVCPHCGRDADA